MIDLLVRLFCTPARDSVAVCSPTYGMYRTVASINNIAVIDVPLVADRRFALDVDKLMTTLQTSKGLKICFLCSPGNPSGQMLDWRSIESLLAYPHWQGIVVVDEAYVDFASEGSSIAHLVTKWPNLVVLQTLSKAFGMAGLRLGSSFAHESSTKFLHNIKPPYNISTLTSQIAKAALQPRSLEVFEAQKQKICAHRDTLCHSLLAIPGVGRHRGGFDANFLLMKIQSDSSSRGVPNNDVALKLCQILLQEHGILIRYRGDLSGCEGCVRITVGTNEDNVRLLGAMANSLSTIYSQR